VMAATPPLPSRSRSLAPAAVAEATTVTGTISAATAKAARARRPRAPEVILLRTITSPSVLLWAARPWCPPVRSKGRLDERDPALHSEPPCRVGSSCILTHPRHPRRHLEGTESGRGPLGVVAPGTRDNGTVGVEAGPEAGEAGTVWTMSARSRLGDDLEPLLERDDARAWLEDHFEGVRGDGGRLVAVTGEAGIGKTSLVNRFAGRHRRDADVRRGACDPLTTPRPLAPLTDLAAGAAWLDLLDEDGGRAAAFEAFRRELADQDRPSIVILEDLHWVDDATVDLLVFLRRRLATTRALIVITYRDDELTADHPLRVALGELIDRSRSRLRLTPL
jgi:hypothetical protein